MENSRTVFSIWGVFGNVGGVVSALAVLAGLFLAPYSEMCFRMHAITELFLVESNAVAEKMDFTIKDKIISYFNLFCCNKEKTKIVKIGSDLVDEEMDITSLVLTVR